MDACPADMLLQALLGRAGVTLRSVAAAMRLDIRGGGRTPAAAYHALPKAAAPSGPDPGHYRLRYDRLDTLGKMSIRRAGRMHHLGVGAHHARKRVLAVTDDTTITVIDLDTGETLSTHHIEPAKNYWRNQQRSPGRWPGLR